MIDLICDNPKCGKTFERLAGEVNRKKNKGKPTYCSISCASQVNKIGNNNGDFSRLKPYVESLKDDFSQFKYSMKIIKNRSVPRKGHSLKECEIDLPYLKKIWEEQKGICPFTGWKLILPETSAGWRGCPTPKRASIDRINNDKGYIRGNVRFVSVMFNYCRNGFEDKDVVEFCEAVYDTVKT